MLALAAREEKIVLICRSGNRSALTLQTMSYTQVAPMKTSVKSWNDSDFPLFDPQGNTVDADWADDFLSPDGLEANIEPI